MSVKAAARRTQGQISDGRWYQLESGYQRIRGQEIAIGTTPATVAAAAKAVGWDRREALQTAGFDPDDHQERKSVNPLDEITTDDLLAELRRRIVDKAEPVIGEVIGTRDPRENPGVDRANHREQRKQL